MNHFQEGFTTNTEKLLRLFDAVHRDYVTEEPDIAEGVAKARQYVAGMQYLREQEWAKGDLDSIPHELVEDFRAGAYFSMKTAEEILLRLREDIRKETPADTDRITGVTLMIDHIQGLLVDIEAILDDQPSSITTYH